MTIKGAQKLSCHERDAYLSVASSCMRGGKGLRTAYDASLRARFAPGSPFVPPAPRTAPASLRFSRDGLSAARGFGCTTTGPASSSSPPSASQSNSSPVPTSSPLASASGTGSSSDSSDAEASTCAGGTHIAGAEASSSFCLLSGAGAAAAASGATSFFRPLPARTNSAETSEARNGSGFASSLAAAARPGERKRTKLRLEALALAVAQHSRLVHVHKPARNAAEQPVAARRAVSAWQGRGAHMTHLTNADGTICGSYCGRQSTSR